MIYRHWTRAEVLDEIRRVHRKDQSLSEKDLRRAGRSDLENAIRRRFASLRKALIAAGLDPKRILRQRFWRRKDVVEAARVRLRKWGRVVSAKELRQRDSGLYAAVHRLGGSWRQVAEEARESWMEMPPERRRWTRKAILEELRNRARVGKPIRCGGVQAESPGFATCVYRMFRRWDEALHAAGLTVSSRTVTQRDLAKKLGISMSSVCKILNRKEGATFARDTVRRVFRTARTLGYDLRKAKSYRP